MIPAPQGASADSDFINAPGGDIVGAPIEKQDRA
jgi:hypothetical protein